MSATPVYGIDLGTTYSSIGRVNEHGKPEIIPNAESEYTTPSVVYFERPGHIVVGKHAKASAKLYPERCASLVKRHMGDPSYTFDVDGESYKAEAVSSFILQKLARDAAAHTGEPVQDVVITCPAYFGIPEREATKKAGQLAGLTVRDIINEPTAAAFAYGFERGSDGETVLVYDLGGGTFDVTLIRIEDEIRVVYTTGHHALGGADFDEALVRYLASQFLAEHPGAADPMDDAETLQALWNDAEDVKKGLTARERWPTSLTHKGKRTRVDVTREKLEELTQALIERTLDFTRATFDEGRARGCPPVSRVLLVGGSSRMPVVERRLATITDAEIKVFEPDLAVAKGAALFGLKKMAEAEVGRILEALNGPGATTTDASPEQIGAAVRTAANGSLAGLGMDADRLTGLVTRRIVNVCSKGFGLKVLTHANTHEVDYPISANTPVPCEVTKEYYTAEPNQRSVQISVREPLGQEDAAAVDLTKEVCVGHLTDLPPGLRKGTPIQVTYRLEQDGTLRVVAVEPRSGRELRLEAQVPGVMTDDEVARETGRMLALTVS
jgi:molecular chaperone DnaK